MKNWFSKIYDKKVSATGLAVFRITFFLNFFFEILFLFNKRQLFFDPVPFLEPFELDFTIPLLLWLVVIFGIIIGVYTRLLVILNYLFVLIFISSLTMFEYHMDYIYSGVCFVAMFSPLSNTLSIDSVRNHNYNKQVSQFHYFFIVFVGIGMVYFDSVLHKLSMNLWLSGLGVWLPASVPQITILNDQWILNQKEIMLFLGYFTLVFEGVFIFLFWIKKLRIPFLIIGIGLHIGIFFEFPIPQFALGMLAIYLLMVPNKIWDKLLSVFKDETKSKFSAYLIKLFRVFPKVEITEFSIKKGMKFIFYVLIIFQLNSSLNSPFFKTFKRKVYSGFNKVHLKHTFHDVHESLRKFSKIAFGITDHGVFVDSHFIGYNHIIGIAYKEKDEEIWLPYIDENGMASTQCKGSMWAYLGFRTNNSNINVSRLENGLKRFTAFWASKNNVDLNDAEFVIKVKKIDLPNWEWEKDYLTKQLNKPWLDAGKILWKKKEFKLNLIKPIEDF